jgi:hypothetical protein
MKNYTITVDLENSRIIENYAGCTPQDFDDANKEVKDLMFKHDIKVRIAHFEKTKGVYCTVITDIKKSLINDTWEGSFANQPNFIQVVNYIKDRVKDHKITLWLANLKNMEGVFDSSRDHLTNIVMPGVIRAGLKKEAIVLPKAFSATLTTRDALQKVEQVGKLSIGHFADEEDAITWLIQ